MVSTVICVVFPVAIALGLLRKLRELSWGYFNANVSLDGKVFIVTGANSGVGKETARELAKRNACVVLACRDLNNAQSAIDDIRKSTSSGQLVPMHLNLASFESIREFSKEALEKFPKIDVLINNAGVYFPLQSSERTKEGFEMNFGVNHLGHFLLTKLLMKKLVESAPSRIVVVSSTLHEKGMLDLDDLNMEKRASQFKKSRMNPAYCASKLANAYHCRELATRLKGKGVSVFAVCPGFTYTGLFRHSHLKWWQYLLFMPVAFLYLRTPWQGAQTILHCACSDNLKDTSGCFYRNCQLYESKKDFDSNLQVQLWEKSELLISNTNDK